MNSKKDRLSRIEIIGRLLTKEINNQKMVVLSEEVKASVLNLSSSNIISYGLYLRNQDKNENSDWEHLSFNIDPSMKLSYFMYKEVDCLQWFTKKNVYFLEFLIDDLNERNRNNFWKVLEQCLCSVINKIPIERASLQLKKSSIHYLNNLGKINDLGVHVEIMVKKLEEENKNKMLEEKLTKDISNLQISQPKIGTVLNLNVVKKIFTAQGEIYNYDASKDELINLNKKQKMFLSIYHLDSQRFDYVLAVETSDGFLYSIDKIGEQINGQIMDNQDSKFFCWITSKVYANISGNCLGFLFDKNEESEYLRKLLEKCNYESKNQQSYEEIDKENRKILEKGTDYYHNNCCSDDEEDQKENEREKEEKEEESEEKEEKEEKKSKKKRKKIKNKNKKKPRRNHGYR